MEWLVRNKTSHSQDKTMMKIKFKQTIGIYEKGDVIEMIDPRARQYVAGGFADEVSRSEPKTEKQPAKTPPKTQSKPKAPAEKEIKPDDSE